MTVASVYPFNFTGTPNLACPSPGMIAIYGLFNPRDQRLRYIGKTNAPHRRLTEHCRSGALTARIRKNYWIKSLLRDGLQPLLLVLCWVDQSDMDNVERAYIAEARRLGYDLTNHAPGGGGVVGRKRMPEEIAGTASYWRGRKHTEETKRKISEKIKGRKMHPDVRQAIRTAATGRVVSEETRKKLAEAQKGKKRDPEMMARIHAAVRGRKATPEQIEKSRASHLGLKASPEHRAKIAAANTGRKPSAKTLEILAAYNKTTKGVPKSPAHRAKLAVHLTIMNKRRAAEKRAMKQSHQLMLPFDG